MLTECSDALGNPLFPHLSDFLKLPIWHSPPSLAIGQLCRGWKAARVCFWTNLQHFCLFLHWVKHYKYLPGDSGRKYCLLKLQLHESSKNKNLQSPDEILGPIPDHLSNNMLKCYHGLFVQWRQTRVAYPYVNSWVTAGLQYEITLSNTTSPYHLAPVCLPEIHTSRIMCHRSTAALQDLNVWIK